jgi:hypothetical protein
MKQKMFNNAKKDARKIVARKQCCQSVLLPHHYAAISSVSLRPPSKAEEISVIGKDLGFEGVDSPKVRERLDSHSQALTDTDLIELEEQRAYDEEEEIASEGEGCVSKEILIKEVEQMFRTLETVKQQIMDLDPNVERSMQVRRTLKNGISCYRKTYEEKKKATSVQTTLDKHFSRK